MTSIQSLERMVPVDRNGRVRMPAAQRAAILAEFAASGMTGVAFAAHIGVKSPTFAGWSRLAGKSLRAGRRRRSGHKAIRFLVAAPVQPAIGQALELELPGGARLRITARSSQPDGSSMPKLNCNLNVHLQA